MKKIIVTCILLIFGFSLQASGVNAAYVNGYYKSNGTYVDGYERASLNTIFSENGADSLAGFFSKMKVFCENSKKGDLNAEEYNFCSEEFGNTGSCGLK